MGLTASMTVISAATFKAHKGPLDELDAPARAKKFWLDKAWLELHSAFRLLPKPLPLAISGDRPAFGQIDGGLLRETGDESDDGDEEWDDGGTGAFYMGIATPALVRRLDRALGRVTEEELLAALRAADWQAETKADQRYYRSAFGTLRKAYATAAAEGAALMILIS